jgi:hypothetical protein
MKKLAVLLAVVLAAAVTMSVLADTTALPGSGWWSPFQVQNVGDGTAEVTYTAYSQQSASAVETFSESGTITIAMGSSRTYNPAAATVAGALLGFNTTDKHLPSGFAGGVEIASNQPLRAVVTVNNFPSGAMGVSGGAASAYYQSVQTPGTILSFPVAKNNYFGQTTNFYIQAAGGDATINATFSYIIRGDPTPREKVVTGVAIGQGRTYLLDPAAAGMEADTLGSLTVEATAGQIAGVVIEAQAGVDVGTFALSTKGFSPEDADTVVVAPTNKTAYFNASTGWQLQNTTEVAANAVVTFTISGVANNSPAQTAGIQPGDEFRYEFTIPANGSYLFSTGKAAGANYYKAVEVGGTRTITNGLFFAGKVVADQKLVGTVNEANGGFRILYSSFGVGGATTKLAAPAVKEGFFGQRTALTVQNVGTAATTPTAVYQCTQGGQGGTIGSRTYTVGASAGVPSLAPGEAFNFFQLSNATRWGGTAPIEIPAGEQGFNCAVTVTAGQAIVAVAQESIVSGAQDIKNYEGFNLVP